MASFCIPKQFSDKLKKAAQAGEFDMRKLYDMTSDQRRDYLSKQTSPELGKQINAEFEKAIVSKQKTALEKWVKGAFGIAQDTSKKKDVLDKIKQLDEIGMLNPQNMDDFLADMVEAKLGIGVKPAEMQKIVELSEKIQESAAKAGDITSMNIFDGEGRKNITEYLKNRKELDDYVKSIAPSSVASVFSGTISKGSMLFSPKSTFLNIESNILRGTQEALARRIANRQFGGANSAMARDMFNFMVKTYNETGYDLSRMMSLTDEKMLTGEKMIHAQGPGVTRAVGRVYEDIVFKNMLGKPDVISAAAAFTDSANLTSTRIARMEGLKGEAAQARAREIMQDAFSIEPKTAQGQMTREQAIADAQTSTFTDDSAIAKGSLAVREAINNVTGDLRLGDQIMLFVKTPANVVNAGLDASGLGFLKGTYKILKAYKSGGKEGITPEAIKSATMDAARAGIGMAAATMIASQINPDDFVGAYDPARKNIDQLRNSVNNSIRIGDKWVSLDYFGPLATPLTAMLYAKKYGKDKSIFQKAYSYGAGVGTQALNIPGVSEVRDIYDFLNIKPDEDGAESLTKKTQQSAINTIRSRILPGFVSDLAKVTDDFERETKDGGVFAQLQASIPVWRQALPPKLNSLQQRIQTEPAWSILLFGSRVKSVNQDAIVNEIARLNNVGQLPTITNALRTSKRVTDMKQNMTQEEFEKAAEFYTEKLRENLEKVINEPKYKMLSDEAKKESINNYRDDALEKMLKEYSKPTSKKEKVKNMALKPKK